jgi:sialic acid synthase SpsE
MLSTGMAGLAEIERACKVVESAAADCGKRTDIALLHCVSAYPTPPEQANLRAIPTLASQSGRVVGYSDHTLGIDAAVLSVALGARIIEKHFTLSKTHSDFRDHALSADPAELAELVRRVRLAQTLLGSGDKVLQEAEKPTAAAARRSIVAREAFPAGHLLAAGDLDWLRPGGGLAPGQESLLVGRRLSRAVARGEMITQDMVT